MSAVLILSAAPVRAEGNSAAETSGAMMEIKPNIVNVEEKDLRQELSIKENVGKGRVVCLALGVCPPSSVGATEVLMKAAKVSETGADYLKISIFGYSYKIDMASANIVRHYWGASNLDEFSAGDIVNVHGYLDGADNYLVHAKTVRNVSIQKVHNVFKGVVESVASSTSSFVMKTEERGSQTVSVSADTKIILEGEKIVCVKAPCPAVASVMVGSFSDLNAGDEVVVRGLWDKTLSTIRAQSIVIGGELSPRLFFKEGAEQLKKKLEKMEKPEKFEKLEKKAEEKLEKKIEKMETKPGEKEGILKRIEDLQRMILEIQKKLGVSSESSSTGTPTQ